MTDTVTSVAEAPVPRCPWCSAELPVGEQIQCPSCGANLVADGDPSIPGVTEVIGQAARPSPTEPVRRNRLLSWISGDIDVETGPPAVGDDSPPEAYAPPPRDVRREMLRLQLEADGIVITDDEPAQPDADGDAAVAPAPADGAATTEVAATAVVPAPAAAPAISGGQETAAVADPARQDDTTLQRVG
jgi:hypothetical protein